MSESQEAVPQPKVYISAPGYNNPQRIGTNKIQTVIEKAGYAPLLPMVSSEIPPVDEAEKCLATLREADLVVVWLDGLTAEGISIFTVAGVQTKVNVNFPPDSIELMQAGALLAQKMGKKIGPQQKNKLIVRPGELDAPPPVPAGMTIDYEPFGVALCKLEGTPMNLPDVSVIFEAAYAIASGKPTIAVALVDPIIGMYLGWSFDAVVSSFAKLEAVLKDYASVALESIGTRRKRLKELQALHGVDLHGRRVKAQPKPEPEPDGETLAKVE